MCVPKEQDERTMPLLGTADAWEPWDRPIGSCHSWWWVDTFSEHPWPCHLQIPRDVIRSQGPSTNVPLEVLEKPHEAIVREPHGRCRLLA